MSSASAGQEQIERKVIIRNISPGFIEAYIEILKKRLQMEEQRRGPPYEPVLLLRSPDPIDTPLEQVDPIRWPYTGISHLFDAFGDDDRRKVYEQSVDNLIKKYDTRSASSSSSGNTRGNYFVNGPSASSSSSSVSSSSSSASGLSGDGPNGGPKKTYRIGGSKKFLRNRMKKTKKLLKNRIRKRKSIKLLRKRIRKSIRRKVKK